MVGDSWLTRAAGVTATPGSAATRNICTAPAAVRPRMVAPGTPTARAVDSDPLAPNRSPAEAIPGTPWEFSLLVAGGLIAGGLTTTGPAAAAPDPSCDISGLGGYWSASRT